MKKSPTFSKISVSSAFLPSVRSFPFLTVTFSHLKLFLSTRLLIFWVSFSSLSLPLSAMEPAKIDWKSLEWKFAEDQLYEHINAPKWVDFLVPGDNFEGDYAWFCRPDCKHPKTADGFLRSAPSKLLSSANVSENIPLGDQSRRDEKLKRRVPALYPASPDEKLRFNQDGENQNPNLQTTPNNPSKPMKAAIKSSEDKKKKLIDDETSQNNKKKVPSLKPTLSAKNLFAGRPVLSQITELCNELKKLATRAREIERKNAENLSMIRSERVEKEIARASPPVVQALGGMNKREKERKPLLEVCKAERSEGSRIKGKAQRKKTDEEEGNMPVSLELDNLRCKQSLLQIQTNPPSLQCFSTTCGPNKTPPSEASRSQIMDRGILQEVEKNKEIAK